MAERGAVPWHIVCLQLFSIALVYKTTLMSKNKGWLNQHVAPQHLFISAGIKPDKAA